MFKSNYLHGGLGLQKHWKVWLILEDLEPYLTGLLFTQEQQASCKSRMDAFGKAFLAAYGETHVTHYFMRRLLSEILFRCLLSLAEAL
jgi:hypothetical protein